MTLEQNGYKVAGVPSDEAVLPDPQRKDPKTYDAVITDLLTPGISGLQLAGEIRKIRPELPVVPTSGYVNPEDQAKAEELGVRAILQKPVKAKERF